jgi:sulfur carrier protein
MKIVVNGAWREVAAGDAALQPTRESPTLEAVLVNLGFGQSIVATALNGEFVAAGARARTRVRDGDRVEVLAPMAGG